MDGLYLREKYLLIDTITKYQLENQSTAEIEKLNREKKDRKKERKVYLRLLQKSCFVNKTTWATQSTSNTSNSNFNANIPQWREAISIEEEDIGIRKCRRKINVGIINEEVKGSSSELKDIKICKCSRKIHVDIKNEEMKGNSSEEEEIGIIRCRRRNRVDIINE